MSEELEEELKDLKEDIKQLKAKLSAYEEGIPLEDAKTDVQYLAYGAIADEIYGTEHPDGFAIAYLPESPFVGDEHKGFRFFIKTCTVYGAWMKPERLYPLPKRKGKIENMESTNEEFEHSSSYPKEKRLITEALGEFSMEFMTKQCKGTEIIMPSEKAIEIADRLYRELGFSASQ